MCVMVKNVLSGNLGGFDDRALFMLMFSPVLPLTFRSISSALSMLKFLAENRKQLYVTVVNNKYANFRNIIAW